MKPRAATWIAMLLAATTASRAAETPALVLRDGGLGFSDGSRQDTAAVAPRLPVFRTGQDDCWNELGDPIDCSGTGQDGELQRGLAPPDLRFVVNDDGTVTDLLTGLVWLRDANCFGRLVWEASLDAVAALNDGGLACEGYAAGAFDDWRLANIRELLSHVDYGETRGLPADHPYSNVDPTTSYWSSTSFVAVPNEAWLMLLHGATAFANGKVPARALTWPVRGVPGSVQVSGQRRCWTAQGDPVRCLASGQDAELQLGLERPTPRFRSNGDGTVTDLFTGLVWLQDRSCFVDSGWVDALEAVVDLNAGAVSCSGYAAGAFDDWVLPNLRQLLSLVDFGEAPGLPSGNPFLSAPNDLVYWSSTTDARIPSQGWLLQLAGGSGFSAAKDFPAFVWPVRGRPECDLVADHPGCE